MVERIRDPRAENISADFDLLIYSITSMAFTRAAPVLPETKAEVAAAATDTRAAGSGD
jgi:hypothetical protein